MNKKWLTSTLVTCALLAACGGDKGQKQSTPIHSGDSSGNQASKPANTFRVQAQYQDECGNTTPAANAALIVHDAEFNTEQIINANANGVISYSSESATKTVSLLVPKASPLDNGVTPLIIETFLDQPMSGVGVFSIYNYDSSLCECKTIPEITVSVPLRPNTTPEFAHMEGPSVVTHTTSGADSTKFTQAKICRFGNGQWPVVSALLGFSKPTEVFATVFSDLSTDSIFKELDLTGKPVNVLTHDDNFIQMKASVKGQTHFTNTSFEPQNPVFAFEQANIEYHTLSVHNLAFLEPFAEIDSAYILKSTEKNLSEVAPSYELDVMDIEIQELLSALESSTVSYDLSNSNDIDLVHFSVRASGDDGLVLNWSMKAPPTGNVPSLEKLDISNQLTNQQLAESVSTIRLGLAALDYKGIKSYEEYVEKSKSRASPADELKQEWEQLNHALLVIKVKAEDLSDLGNTTSVLTNLLGSRWVE